MSIATISVHVYIVDARQNVERLFLHNLQTKMGSI